MLREDNEDYLAHFDTGLGYCIAICDGMGGHTAGQVAAQTAIVAIQKYLQDPQNSSRPIVLELKNAIEFANFQLLQLIKERPALAGMGTTCVLALINNHQLYTAHAGDSRIYLIRDKSMQQITKDHSAVQQLVDEGILTRKEARLSAKKNEILKAIGIFDRVSPTVLENPINLDANDRVLLCSDGLTDLVSEADICDTVTAIEDVQAASVRLVELANINGGLDNITVQIVHCSANVFNGPSTNTVNKNSRG